MRTFVREESLKPAQQKPEIEIFDYEKATAIIKNAKTITVGNCACRSVAKSAGFGLHFFAFF